MKIFTLILIVVFFTSAFNASSQFTKGERLLGGTGLIDVNHNQSGRENLDNKYTSFNLSLLPRLGRAVSSNCLIGVMLSGSYTCSKSSNPSADYYSTNTYPGIGAGLFLRQYKTLNRQAGWFIECNVAGDYSHVMYKTVAAGVESIRRGNTYSVNAQVYPGFYYKIAERVFIEASFGSLFAKYSRSKSEDEKNSGFNFGANFPTYFLFGVQFLLNKK